MMILRIRPLHSCLQKNITIDDLVSIAKVLGVSSPEELAQEPEDLIYYIIDELENIQYENPKHFEALIHRLKTAVKEHDDFGLLAGKNTKILIKIVEAFGGTVTDKNPTKDYLISTIQELDFKSKDFESKQSSKPVQYVSVGSGNDAIAYSYDGINWTGLGNVGFHIGQSVAYSSLQNRWIAVGSGISNIAYSKDGIIWEKHDNSILYSGINCVAYSSKQNLWIIGGDISGSYSMAGSKDGETWTGLGKKFKVCHGVTYSSKQNLWVAVGEGDESSIIYSEDGLTWYNAYFDNVVLKTAYGIAYSPKLDLWVSVGDGTGKKNSIAHSKDGKTWTCVGGNTLHSGFGVAYSPKHSLWVAVGNGKHSMAYSTDGINWTSYDHDIFKYSNDVSYNSQLNRWVAVGNGNNSVAYSDDGINWIGKKTHGIGFGVGVYEAPTQTPTQAPTQKSTQVSWVAVGDGDNSIAYSMDGKNWTGLGKDIFETGLGVSYSPQQNLWVAVGELNNSIAYSEDGINWKGLGEDIFEIGNGIAYSSQQDLWVAVGDGNNSIAYSKDGKDWIGLGADIFESTLSSEK